MSVRLFVSRVPHEVPRPTCEKAVHGNYSVWENLCRGVRGFRPGLVVFRGTGFVRAGDLGSQVAEQSSRASSRGA